MSVAVIASYSRCQSLTSNIPAGSPGPEARPRADNSKSGYAGPASTPPEPLAQTDNSKSGCAGPASTPPEPLAQTDNSKKRAAQTPIRWPAGPRNSGWGESVVTLSQRLVRCSRTGRASGGATSHLAGHRLAGQAG